jgi:phosphate starvation-inducible protein PhoH
MSEAQEARKEPMKKRKGAGGKPRQAGLEMRQFNPRGKKQELAADHWGGGKNVVLSGVAGTGKTFLALALALTEAERTKGTVLIVRSAVPSRDMGFMPGDRKEKEALFEDPYADLFSEIYGRGDAYEVAEFTGLVKFTTTSYLRGLTWRNAIVIIEEFQNMTFQELDTVITRVGEDSRVIVTGDFKQSDLPNHYEKTGARNFLRILEEMESFQVVEFGIEDVLRSGMVAEYLGKKDVVAYLTD